jgi:hypothetical protein
MNAPKGIRTYPLHQVAGELADMRGVAAIFEVQDFKWIRSVALYRLDLACF